ncbi:PilZ domain-containing protein [Qipengyuania nanhaisediminis]|uniref:PilZ domain-containing protein n=1 Tax=Qipengyuania nanhaisediminis TaxID=604088 RepID=UPI0038B38510
MNAQGKATPRKDARSAHRASLGLRRAKLVCQTGEYLTLIRDVSEQGVGLGFCHDVPPETRMLLQLSNDLTYPVERVWTGQRQAGYRFGAEVCLDEFLRDGAAQSRPLRLQFSAPVELGIGRAHIAARLLDLSCEGAKISSAARLDEGHLMTIAIEGLPLQLGQVRWSQGKRHGIKFQHPINSEELARCALRHQPFGKTRSSGFARLLAKARAA